MYGILLSINALNINQFEFDVCGYYLIQNEKPLEGIERLNKSLINPYFSNNKKFLGVVYTLLVLSAMQAGDIDSAKQYGYKALEYKSATNSFLLYQK